MGPRTSIVRVAPTDENPKQHIPLDEYAANLRSMVQYLRSVDVPASRVILVTPPPLCEAAWEKECLAQGEPRGSRGGTGAGRPPGGLSVHTGLRLQSS